MDAWLRTHVALIVPAALGILMAGGSTRALVRPALRSERSELVMACHAVSAQDEMTHLTGELMALVRAAGTPSPALDHLLSYAGARPGKLTA